MATIGTFTASDNGYTGSIKTLTLNIKARFVASEKDNDKAPDYPHLRRRHRVRRRLEEDRPRDRPRIPLGQARRSELPGADLRLAGEGRGRRGLHPDLVPPQRRLIQPDHPPRLFGGGAFCVFMTTTAQESRKSLRPPCWK